MKVIVKYYGNLDGVRAIDDSVKVAELLAQYAIVDISEEFFDRLRDVPEVIYIEEPRRVYPTDKNTESITGEADDDVCKNLKMMQSGISQGELSGKGVLMGIIDSGDCVIILSS